MNVNLARNRLLILFFIGVFVLVVMGGSVEGACTDGDRGYDANALKTSVNAFTLP